MDPPSYEEVINQLHIVETVETVEMNSSLNDSEDREVQQEEPKTYWFYLRLNFTIFDVVMSVLALLGYVLMTITNAFDVTMINMMEYCDDVVYNYNRPDNVVGMYFTYVSLGIVFLCICITSIITFSWNAREYVALMIKIFRKIWITSVGFLFLCINVQILQLMFGIPRPFYFSDKDLYNFYCGKEYVMMPKYLNDLDKNLRMSFPSFIMAANCFSTAFLILYLDHFDVGLGPHTTQYVISLFFGGKCVADGVRQYNNHEHHLSDILVGATLGIAIAAFTVRNIKGTVFRNISDLPKYITNGMLYDQLHKIARTFCPVQRNDFENNFDDDYNNNILRFTADLP